MGKAKVYPRNKRSFFGLILAGLFGFLPAMAPAQQTASLSVSENGLPDAPGRGPSANEMREFPGQSTAPSSDQQSLGSISGTVLDINEGMVPEARVTLVDESRAVEHVVLSDSAGRFTFTDLAPGKFKLTITSPGLKTFVSSEILLHAGERHELQRIALPIASTTADVQVTVTQNEIAQEQVKAEEKQRVFGVLPNFYSSYIWNAAPLSSKQKFGLATKSITDPVDFLSSGIVAGIEQDRNTYPGYGQGAQGYAKRYGADYANGAIGRMLSSAVFPSLFHQDPRYFYKGSGSVRSRVLYAIGMAVITKGDNGQWQPNYSYVLGSFAAGGIANAYHPSTDRGARLTIDNALLDIAGHAADNLVREFILRKFTPKVPNYANGKP